MKELALIYIMLLCNQMTVHGQSDCEVKVPELNGEYEGDCKKGLAHGKGKAKGQDSYHGDFKKGLPHGNGIYIWSNGDSFDGEWKKGLREGYGRLTVKTDLGDSLVIGYWETNNYVGLNQYPYKVHMKSSGVSGIRIVKNDKLTTNGLDIQIQLNDYLQQDPDIIVDLASGNFERVQPLNTSMQVINTSVPFRARVRFMREVVDIEVYQPGEWKLVIEITEIKGQGDGTRSRLN